MYKRMPHIYWHDLIIAPDDLPEDHEQILTTTENLDGERRVHTDIYLKELPNDRICWCIYCEDETTGKMEESAFWEPVIAWAYLPDPYVIQRGTY